MPTTGIEVVPYDPEWPLMFEAEAASASSGARRYRASDRSQRLDLYPATARQAGHRHPGVGRGPRPTDGLRRSPRDPRLPSRTASRRCRLPFLSSARPLAPHPSHPRRAARRSRGTAHAGVSRLPSRSRRCGARIRTPQARTGTTLHRRRSREPRAVRARQERVHRTDHQRSARARIPAVTHGEEETVWAGLKACTTRELKTL